MRNNTVVPTKRAAGTEYGVLESRNINKVLFGPHEFNTWYGNGAYFLHHGSSTLGIDQAPAKRKGSSPPRDQFWLDKLHVCEFCFKYTAQQDKMMLHRTVCNLNKAFPPLGKLVYADMRSPYLIKKVRGYRHELFCQNLSLFGKLFLEDKSVYYNVEAFDFYVIYGYDSATNEPPTDTVLRNTFKPMGFFSKEVNSWEPDNNLACVCVFPPYQRLHLGSLLVEFLYELARVTPGQDRLGPEFPLSPFGKVTYIRYWSKRLAFALLNDFAAAKAVSLTELADLTGFRKEDVLFTLEHMSILQSRQGDEVVVLELNLLQYCDEHRIEKYVLAGMLDRKYLLI